MTRMLQLTPSANILYSTLGVDYSITVINIKEKLGFISTELSAPAIGSIGYDNTVLSKRNHWNF